MVNMKFTKKIMTISNKIVIILCVGEPTWSNKSCPTGYVCTGETYVCYLKTEGYTGICQIGEIISNDEITTSTTLAAGDVLSESCDVCLSGNASCHSETTYSICLNGEYKNFKMKKSSYQHSHFQY